MVLKLHIGMRKMKSLLAVILSFLSWQLIRIFLPELSAHPIFAYIYSVIEMRESSEKTKTYGKLRIRATIVGLVIGLIFIALSVFFCRKTTTEALQIFVQFIFILIAILCSLSVAEVIKCENFCGIAASITLICMVSHNEEDVYLYAIMRVVQTLIGIFSAMVVNVFISKRNGEETEHKAEKCEN